MARMATSSSFKRADKHILQFRKIQTYTQIPGFIIRLAIALSLKLALQFKYYYLRETKNSFKIILFFCVCIVCVHCQIRQCARLKGIT